MERNYFTEYKELGQTLFEKLKTEYLDFMEKSREYIKVNRHNEYRNDIYRPNELEINKELGSRQNFFIVVKEECNNDKTKKYSEVFNEKFNEIPEEEKSKILKLLAEKRAWDNMFNFWGLMGDYYNKIETLPLIELIISAQPEIANFFDTLLEQKKNLFLSKLKTRISKEEQLSFANKEILKLRENIEGDSINDIYNYFTQTLNEILSHAKNFGESFLLSKKLFPQEFPMQSQEFNSLIEKGLISNLEFNEAELSNFFNQLEKIGFKSGLIETAGKSEDKKQAILYVLIYFHYEKMYLNFLIDKVKVEAETNESEDIIKQKDTAIRTKATKYLLQALGCTSKIDEQVKFVRYLLGKDETKKVEGTNEDKAFQNNETKKTKDGKIKDLEKVIELFNALNLAEPLRLAQIDFNRLKK